MLAAATNVFPAGRELMSESRKAHVIDRRTVERPIIVEACRVLGGLK